MAQQLQRFFGLRVRLVRDLNAAQYDAFAESFKSWLHAHPDVKALDPQLYIHRVVFEISPVHFTVAGIENRVNRLALSVEINPKQQEKKTMKFINGVAGHRLSPTIKHSFGEYKNSYFIEGKQLTDASHFEEYLATVVLKSLSEGDRKVKFTLTADATPAYNARIRNVNSSTKLDFKLSREVQLTLF